VTLGGFCVFAVIFSAVYAKRTEVALGICSILFVLMPTYFVHNYEVPFNNWLLGSVLRQPQSGPSPGPSPNPHPGLHRQVSPMSASKGEVLSAVWSASPNTSRYDEMLGLSVVGLSLMHFSMFNPGIALIINTSEVHQQGSMDHGHSAWLAAGCPCGHPPLQRPSRLLKAAILRAREEHPSALAAWRLRGRLEAAGPLGGCGAVVRLQRHSGCLPRLSDVAALGCAGVPLWAEATYY
jgi:hypothetical protein